MQPVPGKRSTSRDGTWAVEKGGRAPRDDTAAASVLSSARATPLSDAIVFLRGFVARPREVGSVVPSSHVLEQHIVEAAGAAHARTVVELGPGTGGTTRALLRAMPPDARLLALELSGEFHARLVHRLRDRRLSVLRASAEELLAILRARQLPPPDAIVSGIPFSTLPQPVGDRIAAAIAQCLAPGGRFVAYQVRAHVAQRVAPYLGPPRVQWVGWNVPPLRVFRWHKPRRADGTR